MIARGGVAVVAVLGRRAGGADAGGGDRDDGDEAEPLVDLQHVGALVEEGLALGAAFGLRRGEAEVAEGGPVLGGGFCAGGWLQAGMEG
jgi:hypothetical protein